VVDVVDISVVDFVVIVGGLMDVDVVQRRQNHFPRGIIKRGTK
jgi:hypothetical protein